MIAALPDGRELLFVLGVEPSFRWQAFTDAVIGQFRERGVKTLWLLGALLADVPHTRPLRVQASSSAAKLRRRFDALKPTYEGPAGIVTVLAHAAWQAPRIPTGSLWVPVPHYVGNPPSPTAELALVAKLTEVLELEDIDTSELADQARDWAAGVDRLAAADPEVAGYVATLEEAFDQLDASSVSGEELAQEFERYLRRHGS
jgi:hypothetical protein